jgi:hypothetical protein
VVESPLAEHCLQASVQIPAAGWFVANPDLSVAKIRRANCRTVK